MLANLFKPFTQWGTEFRGNLAQDPLLRARFFAIGFFAVVAVLSFSLVGVVTDTIAHNIITDSFSGTGSDTVEGAIEAIDQVRWAVRALHLLIIGVATYFVLKITLQPVGRAVEFQKRFIENLSHELKTPLAVATTETEVALRSKATLSREEAIALLEKNLSRLNHISRVFDYLLSLSDLRATRSRGFSNVSLSDVARDAVERQRESLGARNVTLSLSADSAPQVFASALALEKMLTNLIRNAVVHTPPGGEVRIRVTETGGRPELSVEDAGRGIPAEDLPRVFEAFYQSKTAAPGGSGLGLSIVKEIARLHRAKIGIESEEGKGTRVTVAFPKSPAIPSRS